MAHTDEKAHPGPVRGRHQRRARRSRLDRVRVESGPALDPGCPVVMVSARHSERMRLSPASTTEEGQR